MQYCELIQCIALGLHLGMVALERRPCADDLQGDLLRYGGGHAINLPWSCAASIKSPTVSLLFNRGPRLLHHLHRCFRIEA